MAFKLDLVICLNVFLSPEIIGISIISWSSLGDETREPYKVFNLSALEILVDKPRAISNVTLLLPTPIASPYTNLLFSKTYIEDVEWPKSIQITPRSFSSFVRDDKDEDNGVGI